MPQDNPWLPERIGIGLAVVLFAVPGILLWVATRIVVPALVSRGWEPLTAWFAAGGGLVFGPLLAASLIVARRSAPDRRLAALLGHLRLRPLSGAGWRLALAALAATLALMAGIQLFNTAVWPGLAPHPPFMTVKPLTSGQHYILALWVPFFFFNIIGEELWWRGVIQPRQELVHGRATWIVQGVLHGAFHLSFGAGVMLAVLPVLFSVPWAVQRSQSTWAGVVIHGGVNGPGFLAVTLGLMPA